MQLQISGGEGCYRFLLLQCLEKLDLCFKRILHKSELDTLKPWDSTLEALKSRSLPEIACVVVLASFLQLLGLLVSRKHQIPGSKQ